MRLLGRIGFLTKALVMSLQVLAPFLFAFLWSTGFVGAKSGWPYAEPMTFLLLRYVLVGVYLDRSALRAPVIGRRA